MTRPDRPRCTECPIPYGRECAAATWTAAPTPTPDDDWGNGTGTDLVTACVDAMHAAQAGWGMLAQWLGRSSGFDGYGRSFPVRVGYDDANAFYDTFIVVYGNSSRTRQATSTDIVMHELGHAIFDFTPCGSQGTREKGGLNEPTGDIFGTVTEWYLNEPTRLDLPDYATPGTPSASPPPRRTHVLRTPWRRCLFAELPCWGRPHELLGLEVDRVVEHSVRNIGERRRVRDRVEDIPDRPEPHSSSGSAGFTVGVICSGVAAPPAISRP
ncbi:hypothetical protein AB0H88_41605 [Nonomuraea sp. NPDC050680]|uniref:hypothetical protein n=1 Tax=Nonomuraea sp. NPDC050680 TaxID=3154630 RepID=UPI00340BF058